MPMTLSSPTGSLSSTSSDPPRLNDSKKSRERSKEETSRTLKSVEIDLLNQYDAHMCARTPKKGWRPNRTSKQVWRSKSTNSNRPVHVPHRPERENMSPATKYANTGRKAKSFQGPTVMARLQSLQSQLNALRSTIHRKPRVTRIIEAEPSWLTRYDGPIEFTSEILIGYVCTIEDKQINRRQCFCRQP